MSINLRNYVKNTDEVMTFEEAEQLFIAAGYVKAELELEPETELGRLNYKDCNENLLSHGDVFVYQFGTPSEVEGKIKVINGVYFIQWSDRNELEILRDFWFAPVDQKITKIINKL